MRYSNPVGIVGGGLAGLSCARILHREGVPYRVFESDTRIGGKLKTDWIGGFGMDHGFQVLFTAYPALNIVLRAGQPETKPFIAGALIWDGTKLNSIRQDRLVSTATNGLFGVSDKIKTLQLKEELKNTDLEDIASMPDISTSEYLRSYGFSEDFFEYFARPFFGGIFLDAELAVTARQFAFVWKMLAEGQTVLPLRGMAQLAQAVAEPLFNAQVQTGVSIQNLSGEVGTYRLASDEGFDERYSEVVLACDPRTAFDLLGMEINVAYRSSTCLYFETDGPIVEEPIIVLNGLRGLVNTVVPVSQVSAQLAPKDRHLVSVTILGEAQEDEVALASACLEEIKPWFPRHAVRSWRHLKTFRIRNAQLAQLPDVFAQRPGLRSPQEGIHLAGEYWSNSSIQGAIQSGVEAAWNILRRQRRSA